jgi:hypothetical protein
MNALRIRLPESLLIMKLAQYQYRGIQEWRFRPDQENLYNIVHLEEKL